MAEGGGVLWRVSWTTTVLLWSSGDATNTGRQRYFEKPHQVSNPRSCGFFSDYGTRLYKAKQQEMWWLPVTVLKPTAPQNMKWSSCCPLGARHADTERGARHAGAASASGVQERQYLGLFYKSDIWVRVAIFFSWLWRVINVVSSFSLHNNHFLQLWVETSDRNMLVWGHLLRLSLSKEGGCAPVGTWSTQGHASEVSPQINLWPVRSHSCFCTIHIRDDPWNRLHSGDLIRRLKQPSVYGSDEKHYEASPKQRKQKSR